MKRKRNIIVDIVVAFAMFQVSVMPNQVAFAATKPGKVVSSSIKSSSISYY